MPARTERMFCGSPVSFAAENQAVRDRRIADRRPAPGLTRAEKREKDREIPVKRELELYIHIPFCVRKCAYCDFLSAPASQETMRAYVDVLCREIREFPRADQYEVSTVFLGGGTPSILPPELTGQILSTVREKFRFVQARSRTGRGAERSAGPENAEPIPDKKCGDPGFSQRLPEITIECNPGTADMEKLAAWRRMGINRLSLGLQSADDKELRCLGRIHTWKDFLATYHDARRAGFENINIDLMSALPGQTVDSWKRTLEKVLALSPEHISAYSLIIEEGTPFYDRYGEDARRRDAGEPCVELPSEEEEREMYRLTEQYLQKAGLYRYEISNYARPGYECRHNCGYWRRTEYAGFGLGAASLLALPETVSGKEKAVMGRRCAAGAADHEIRPHTFFPKNYRYKNPEDLAAYLAYDFSDRQKEELSAEDQMEEFMFLGLRMTRGVSERAFEETFGVPAGQIYGREMEKLEKQGLLCRENGRIFLSVRGTDLANYVMAEFLVER